jgi:VanZ family protein
LRLRALWLALGWAMVGAIVWLSLTPSPPTLDFEQSDKLGHFAGYGVLMFWFCELHAARRARIGYGAGFVAMGVALEFVQDALGYRDSEAFDMLANALGVLIGWLAALAAGPRLLEKAEALLRRPLRE